MWKQQVCSWYVTRSCNRFWVADLVVDLITDQVSDQDRIIDTGLNMIAVLCKHNSEIVAVHLMKSYHITSPHCCMHAKFGRQKTLLLILLNASLKNSFRKKIRRY